MFIFLLLFFAAVLAAAFLILLVKAFQTSVGWGFITLLVPFGWVVFLCKHWQAGKAPFAVILCTYVALVILLLNTPEGMKRAFTEAYRRAQLQQQQGRTVVGGGPPAPGRPHEARDLAENEPPTATPVFDSNAVQRAAYAKHGVDLMAEYQQLNAERTALKPGDHAALVTFNAKAAHYQSGLQALQAEQAQLDALDHPGAVAGKATFVMPGVMPSSARSSGPEAEANLALANLKSSVGQGDYAGFAANLKKCLADYRQTTVFPQITAYARQVMHSAPPAKLTAILQQQAKTAQAEYDATTRQVQTVVNQIPPTVVPPPNNQEIYHYVYHPGATKPDFNTADVLTGREPWNGEYVYMDDRPGDFYRSADCEFNPQTKFFYTRRDVPKKKLTDTENREVIRLYRILGKDETIINTLTQRLAVAKDTSAELVALNTQLGTK